MQHSVCIDAVILPMSIRGLKLDDGLDGSGMKIGIVKAKWNTVVVDSLVYACQSTLTGFGVPEVIVESVGGAFELPVAVQSMVKSGRFDAVIAIGCLIKGETMHFEYISEAAVNGIMRVSLDAGVPVTNGILNVLSEGQALARAGLEGTHGNEGIGWAKTTIQQVQLVNKYRK